jgi:hypothetical protein
MARQSKTHWMQKRHRPHCGVHPSRKIIMMWRSHSTMARRRHWQSWIEGLPIMRRRRKIIRSRHRSYIHMSLGSKSQRALQSLDDSGIQGEFSSKMAWGQLRVQANAEVWEHSGRVEDYRNQGWWSSADNSCKNRIKEHLCRLCNGSLPNLNSVKYAREVFKD